MMACPQRYKVRLGPGLRLNNPGVGMRLTGDLELQAASFSLELLPVPYSEPGRWSFVESLYRLLIDEKVQV